MLARINRSYVPAYWDDFFNDKFFNQVKSTGSLAEELSSAFSS